MIVYYTDFVFIGFLSFFIALTISITSQFINIIIFNILNIQFKIIHVLSALISSNKLIYNNNTCRFPSFVNSKHHHHHHHHHHRQRRCHFYCHSYTALTISSDVSTLELVSCEVELGGLCATCSGLALASSTASFASSALASASFFILFF